MSMFIGYHYFWFKYMQDDYCYMSLHPGNFELKDLNSCISLLIPKLFFLQFSGVDRTLGFRISI